MKYKKDICPMEECPVAGKCGGCQLQNLPYSAQLRHKQSQVRRLLGRYGRVSPIISMDDPCHYRNKAQTAFGLTRGGKVISGVWQSGSGHITVTDNCLLEDEVTAPIAVTLRKLLCSFRIPPYDMRTGRGCLRFVMVRRGFATGQIMVVLVTGGQPFHNKEDFTSALIRNHPEITTVVFAVNESDKNLMIGPKQQVTFGDGTIEDVLCGVRFRISSRSFYQVNPVQTEKLYRTAIELADLKPGMRVIDAYCGIGSIALSAAYTGADILGVESNPDAVEDARDNARRNGITNARFTAMDAGAFMAELAAVGESVQAVFADPPRAGCSHRFLESLVALAPEKVVYISCNPETQARDMHYLTRHGYKAEKIQPVDMFPHTNHVECVVLMSRNI